MKEGRGVRWGEWTECMGSVGGVLRSVDLGRWEWGLSKNGFFKNVGWGF